MKKNFCLTIILFICTFYAYSQPTIPVDSAKEYVGKTVIICSTVFGTKALEKITFINLGAATPIRHLQ